MSRVCADGGRWCGVMLCFTLFLVLGWAPRAAADATGNETGGGQDLATPTWQRRSDTTR